MIKKSLGFTRTESLLSELCDKTFLRLWSYPNPYKDDGKELCDLIAVFGNHVFIFFDRESRKFDGSNKDVLTTWSRWKKEAIDKQIQTAKGAERYIKTGKPIFLDPKKELVFPLSIPNDARVHKFIVAHGAKEACAAFSADNVYGSLGVSYGDNPAELTHPFLVDLDRKDPVHLLDSHNVEILFGELDTFSDLTAYVEKKECSINKYSLLTYCGEEDLIAHYYLNYDEYQKSYKIGSNDTEIDSFMIGEGEYKSFIETEIYKARKTANRDSYLWDELIQRTCQNALDGTLLGTANLLGGQSAVHEMAKEPRLSRRVLSQHMIEAIRNFPENDHPITRNMSFMPSFYKETSYVFLQIKHANIIDYENDYRPKRQVMLEIACGAAKNKFPHLKKIVGIAIDAPKFAKFNSEDFILLDCERWPKELEDHYREQNKSFQFFATDGLRATPKKVSDFP